MSAMQAQLPYIESLIESGRYPLLARVVFDARAPHDPDRLKHGFDVGLERVLDGLATMPPNSSPAPGAHRRNNHLL
jgi:hypothetical protein